VNIKSVKHERLTRTLEPEFFADDDTRDDLREIVASTLGIPSWKVDEMIRRPGPRRSMDCTVSARLSEVWY
jgi:hypothetical protein